MKVPVWAWVSVLAVIAAMLVVDLLAHRRAHVVSVREAAAWSGVWVALGVGFGVVVWGLWGGEFAAQYFAGYVIEKSLAVDNIFVFAIVFATFAVPRELQHRVLFYGVLGALVFCAIFIAAGSVLIASFGWEPRPRRQLLTDLRERPARAQLLGADEPPLTHRHLQRDRPVR